MQIYFQRKVKGDLSLVILIDAEDSQKMCGLHFPYLLQLSIHCLFTNKRAQSLHKSIRIHIGVIIILYTSISAFLSIYPWHPKGQYLSRLYPIYSHH